MPSPGKGQPCFMTTFSPVPFSNQSKKGTDTVLFSIVPRIANGSSAVFNINKGLKGLRTTEYIKSEDVLKGASSTS